MLLVGNNTVSLQQNSRTDISPYAPHLSHSAQSVADKDEAASVPLETAHPHIYRQDSAIGRNGDISSANFASMPISKDKLPPSSPQQEVCKHLRTIVVRSFSPEGLPTAFWPSQSEPGASIESPLPVAYKESAFHIEKSSSEETSLGSVVSGYSVGAKRKHASSRNKVSTHTIEHVDTFIDSDAEDDVNSGDVVNERAIDGYDDSSDWEDSPDCHSDEPSIDGKFFQRVNSTTNLPPRSSLIALALAQIDRSQSTSALRADFGPRGLDSRTPPKAVSSSGVLPTQAVPPYINLPVVPCPKANRHTMLVTELTDSLRRDIIWERCQKFGTANAVNRHRTTDFVDLQQRPGKGCLRKQEDYDAERWNEYFAKVQFDEYHSRGW